MTLTATVGGWLVASIATVVVVAARHAASDRMEAVARACHELRGPITAARLGLQFGARSAEPSAARLRAIDLELARAALALDDLGGVRRGRRPTCRLQEVNVHELLVDSVEAWRAGAAARGAQLRMHWSGGPARVLGDRLRLAQATGNLIANAIEHGGGLVEVRGHAEAQRVRLEVLDRGPGLPAPVADVARRASGGRGTRGRGLAIAAAIAEDHGGRLAAAPTERGARLVLELPAAPGPAPLTGGRPVTGPRG